MQSSRLKSVNTIFLYTLLDFDDDCLVNPENCPNGFTVVFWLFYDGRGKRINTIFSSGAEQWVSCEFIKEMFTHMSLYYISIHTPCDGVFGPMQKFHPANESQNFKAVA